MSTEDGKGWECRFCFEQLKQTPLIGWRRALWFIPVRSYRCSHCFHTFQKPTDQIARLPFVRGIFCEKRGVTARIRGIFSVLRSPRKSSRRNYVNPGWLVRFSRWSTKFETTASERFKGICKRLWLILLWPFRWLSKIFLKSKDSSSTYPSKGRRRSSSQTRDE